MGITIRFPLIQFLYPDVEVLEDGRIMKLIFIIVVEVGWDYASHVMSLEQ